MLHAWFASPTILLMIWRRLIAVCLARTSFLQHGQGASVPAAWAVQPAGYWIRHQPSLISTAWHSPRIISCSTASPWVLMNANLSLCKDKSFQIPGNIQSFCPSIEDLPSSFLLLNGGILSVFPIQKYYILSVFPRFNIFNKQQPFIFCLHVSKRGISIFKR